MISDDKRRQKIYDGQLFVYSVGPSTLAFCKFAKELIEEAFNRYTSSPSQTDPPSVYLDPFPAQYARSVRDYAVILTQLKPTFIYPPDSKRHLQHIFRELGCDLMQTYFDVPTLRSSTSDASLRPGLSACTGRLDAYARTRRRFAMSS